MFWPALVDEDQRLKFIGQLEGQIAKLGAKGRSAAEDQEPNRSGSNQSKVAADVKQGLEASTPKSAGYQMRKR
jgi:hypothetical protein